MSPEISPQSNEHEAVVAITDARERLTRARQALARAQLAFDKTVAEAISTEPTKPTWYSAPGYVSAALARATGNLTVDQLHNLMERYRRTNGRKRGR